MTHEYHMNLQCDIKPSAIFWRVEDCKNKNSFKKTRVTAFNIVVLSQLTLSTLQEHKIIIKYTTHTVAHSYTQQ